MKTKTVLIIYGHGGHREQARRVMKLLNTSPDTQFIGIGERGHKIKSITNYTVLPIRSKFSKWSILYMLPLSVTKSAILILWLLLKYRVRGAISTGPGIAVIPMFILKLMKIKTVFIETWSRFETMSWTGKYAYKLTRNFYVQHRELLSIYPQAKYSGLL